MGERVQSLLHIVHFQVTNLGSELVQIILALTVLSLWYVVLVLGVLILGVCVGAGVAGITIVFFARNLEFQESV